MSERKRVEPTPGPWTFSPYTTPGGTKKLGVSAASEGEPRFGLSVDLLAEIMIPSNPKDSVEWVGQEKAEANARLIAAAPDLLEALRLAREYVAKIHGSLAKAEGR